MTGSLSKNSDEGGRAVKPALPHALSPQWEQLVAAAERQNILMKSQPEAWWRVQAEHLSRAWLNSGLPTTRLEEWKYTSLVHLHAKPRVVGLGPVDVSAPEGVRVVRLSQISSEASISDAERVKIRELLEAKSAVFFENVAKSLVSDPFIVVVPEKLKSSTSIEITWRGLPEGQWGFGVAAVIVGAGADISLIERYGSGVDAQTHTTLLDIGSHACVSHLRIQTGDNKTDSGVVISNVRARVAAGSKYENAQVSFGSALSREDLSVELTAAEAETITDGVFIGRSGQVLDHHTNLVHLVGSTTSRQVYKGILADESRGVFNGRIAIAKNASGSNSAQMNKNLLLSKKVELDTKPQLEIDNDDVKAAHGAAIGRLDPEHVFYLRSRGIGMGQAVEMLARGFAYEAVQRLGSESLREIGTREIERGLRGLSWESL